MKYKIGDRVKVRSDLTSSKLYDGYGVVDKMIRKREKIVTITVVHVDYYEINEDTFCWTDQMFEGLVEEKLTAAEATKILGEICCENRCLNGCPIGKVKGKITCQNFRKDKAEQVIEILKQWKKDHEKKEIETEIIDLIQVMKEENDSTTCIYAYEIDASKENIDEKMDELVKQYYEENGGKIYAKCERICRVI